MGSAASRVCFLSIVGGHFKDTSEWVGVTVALGRWYLTGSSKQSGVRATARCIPASSYSAEVTVTSAAPGVLVSPSGMVETPRLQAKPRSGVRDIVRRVAAEHELEILSGKVARDHVHVLVSYRPTQRVSQIVQWLKETSSRVLLQEFPRLRKQFWGKHLWARRQQCHDGHVQQALIV